MEESNNFYFKNTRCFYRKCLCPISQACAAVELNYSVVPSYGLLRGVRCLETDVSGLLTYPLLQGQDQEEGPLKVEQIGSPETLVSNYFTPRHKPEQGRIQVLQYLICLDSA